ncbi:hypothetical protein MPTK1_2g05980 [Marchantia polymorpha subsp. ruderalis]|uniref:Uncharacterized protein n=1 Tax=Marchantia polymorpha TaxID=3197 RepID=A0A2R6XDL0_MARPO|nr:hypothetical protein MARPO_0021s0053 [Marchantia polymorpha]BBN01259.1 hypothetical protein Mp_2g05980 [Marchantia polymorpha subsp. ruderalis]|eukprot:PTQ44184.1 hypothetical protein MARPO_0021s0053 [Marchantia polymorpha]
MSKHRPRATPATIVVAVMLASRSPTLVMDANPAAQNAPSTNAADTNNKKAVTANQSRTRATASSMNKSATGKASPAMTVAN